MKYQVGYWSQKGYYVARTQNGLPTEYLWKNGAWRMICGMGKHEEKKDGWWKDPKRMLERLKKIEKLDSF